MAEAAHEVVVDDAHRLQVGVDDDRADEAEAALREVAGRAAPRGACGPAGRPGARAATTAGRPSTADQRKASRPPSRSRSRRTAAALSRKARTLARLRMMRGSASSSRLPIVVVGGHAPGIEAVVGGPVALPAAQDGGPREAGLGALEAEHLEEALLVVERLAPLVVVVGHHERVVAGPAAAGQAPAAEQVVQ